MDSFDRTDSAHPSVMFNNSSSHYIRNATFNVVYGNQYNYTHYYQNDDPPEEEWKLKLKREYDRIPAGKIKIIKTISETGIWRHEYEDGLIDQKERLDSSRAKRVVHIACLDMERAESSPLLCVSYTGRDAHKVFKREFIALSRIRHSSVIQLRGFNDSDIPMILFQQELIPVKHILQRHRGSSLLLKCYFSLQASIAAYTVPEWLQTELKSWGSNNVWIQPGNGRIVLGTQGPHPDFFPIRPDFRPEHLESCSDFPVLSLGTYDDHHLFNYLFGYSSDKFLLHWLSLRLSVSRARRHPPRNCQVCTPSGQPVARFPFQRWLYTPWYYEPVKDHVQPIIVEEGWSSVEDHFHPIITEDGRTRFTITSTTQLRNFYFYFYYQTDVPSTGKCMSWLSQSYHIFNMLDIPKEEWPGCGYHYAVELYLEQPSFPGCNRDGDFDSLAADQTPCYLFLFPPPQIHDGSPDVDAWTSGRNLYYYSFDPDGQSALSDSQRVSLGLPSFITDAVQSASGWSSDVYELIRAWQEVKGFNPNTTDFARSLGLPIMEVMSLNEDWERFEVLSGNSGSRVSVVDEARDGAMDVDLPMCSPHLSQNASLDGPTYNSFIDPVLSKSESLVLVDADMMEVD